jgi:hypothetical protein
MPYTDPFHTSSYEADPVYHNNSACEEGQRVKRDGNALDGDDGRRLCDDCTDLNRKGK